MYRILMTALLAFTLSACGDDAPTETAPTPPAAQKNAPQPAPKDVAASQAEANPDWPTYLVGTEATYQPFEFKDEQGKPVGFEIDLLNAIAQNQKFNVQILPDLRKNAETALNAGKHRIWVSAFQIGVDIDARYSDSLMSFYRVVAVPDTSAIQTVADLKGKKIAINQHSSKETLDKATKLTGDVNLVDKQNTFVLAIQSALAGEKADAVLGDVNMLRYYASQHPDVKFRYISIDDPVGEIGFAVQKNDAEMQEKLNAGLKAIKADGSYEQIRKKWFGATE